MDADDRAGAAARLFFDRSLHGSADLAPFTGGADRAPHARRSVLSRPGLALPLPLAGRDLRPLEGALRGALDRRNGRIRVAPPSPRRRSSLLQPARRWPSRRGLVGAARPRGGAGPAPTSGGPTKTRSGSRWRTPAAATILSRTRRSRRWRGSSVRSWSSPTAGSVRPRWWATRTSTGGRPTSRTLARSGCPFYADDAGRPYRRRVDPPEGLFVALEAHGLVVPRHGREDDQELGRAESIPADRVPRLIR